MSSSGTTAGLPRRNIVAGTAQTLGTAVLNFAAVPLYLRYLGLDAYGLVGFFATLQGILQLLDLGLSPTVNREVAQGFARNDLAPSRRLVNTLAKWYWGVGLLIFVLGGAASPLIAHHWLRSERLSAWTIQQAVFLMSVVIAVRWPISLYQAVLIGAQRITVSSLIGLASTAVATLGALLLLAFVSPTIQTFFLWQVFATLGQLCVIRYTARRILGRSAAERTPRHELRRILRFSAAMSGIAVSELIFTQLDKALLSRLVPLDEFGRYMLASSVTAVVYSLVVPVFTSMYPRFSALVAAGDEKSLRESYQNATGLVCAVLFPPVMVLAFFGKALITAWTGDLDVAARTAPVVTRLVLGSGLHGAMNLPYALQLAYGEARLPLAINTVLGIALVPLIIVSTLHFGVIGAASTWLILHVSYVVVGTWLTHRKLLTGLGRKWLLQWVLPRYALAGVIVAGIATVAEHAQVGTLVHLSLSVLAGGLAMASIVVVSPNLRAALRFRRLKPS